MGKMNKLLIISMSILVLAALAGTASAAVTFKVDKIETIGVYHGIPTLLSGDNYQYGYDYVLIPDYCTVYGKVYNYGTSQANVGVDIGFVPDVYYKDFSVPAATGTTPGVATFAITMPKANGNDIKVWVTDWINGPTFAPFNLSGVEYVESEEPNHTVDQGPMSDTVTIYTGSSFNFSNSTLYAFVG